MIYLDSAATTKPCAEAVAALSAAASEDFGNPSSLHSVGLSAAAGLKEARKRVASAMGATPGEIVFTSGGTEADNWAIFSAMKANRHVGGHIITTSVEHHGVLNAVKQMEMVGKTATYVNPDKTGRIEASAVLEALRPDTALISVMMINNESGAVFPVAEIAAALKRLKHPAILHADGVQALFKMPFSAKKLGADMISVSAHKIGGVKGAGALYVRKGLHLRPLIVGGGQEGGLRSGTEPMPAIAAFGAACDRGASTMIEDIAKMAELRNYAVGQLLEDISGCVINGPLEAPHIISVSMPGCPSQVLINALSAEGICVSAGSACSKGKRSHVLVAQGLSSEIMDSAIRVSLCPENSKEDIDALVEGLSRAKARIGGRRG